MRLLNRKTRNDYRKLYEIELNNRRLYEDRYKQIYEQHIENQKMIKELQKEITNLKIELIDKEGFLNQEKEAKEALKKERTQLRKKITELGGDWKNGK
jgi:predicted  nucleic acid-binding Zn-ribbon protein